MDWGGFQRSTNFSILYIITNRSVHLKFHHEKYQPFCEIYLFLCIVWSSGMVRTIASELYACLLLVLFPSRHKVSDSATLMQVFPVFILFL